MKILIAAPIGDGKEYSINEWFRWISENTWNDYDVALCVNGRSEGAIRRQAALLKMVEINNRPLKVLRLPYRESDSTKMRLILAREELRRYAARKDYDYIFWLDTDTIPVIKDAIETLLLTGKDVVSGTYFYKGTKQSVVISEETQTNIPFDEVVALAKSGELKKVWGFGYGCLLMHRSVFEKIPFDYNYKREQYSDDFAHCEAMENAGIERWYLAKVFCKHYHSSEFKVGAPACETGPHEEDKDINGSEDQPAPLG